MSHTPTGWYKWHPRDFNMSMAVRSMSFTARAIYRELLDIQWENGCLTDVERMLNVLRVTREQWAEFEPFLDELFPNGINPRMQQIRDEALANQAKKSAAGSKSAEKRSKINASSTPVEQVFNEIEKETEEETEDLDKQRGAGAIQNSDGALGSSPRPPMTVDIQGYMNLLGVSPDRSAEEAEKYASDRKRKGWKIGNTFIADWREDVKMWVDRMPEFARGGGTSPPGGQRGRESGIDQAARILAQEGLLVQ